MGSNCRCALLALRMLVRVEELTTTSKVPLETALQITEEAESRSLAVLNCEPCRQQRFALTAVTVLSARMVDWLRQFWQLNDAENDHDKTAAANNERLLCPVQPWRFSLGSYDLDPEEAGVLGDELMALRFTRLSAVLGTLEAALLPSGGSSALSSSPGSTIGSNESACLELVRSNLCLLRACIRRLKTRSLPANGAGMMDA